MQIGLITDTHNNVEGIKKACDIFRKNNIKLIIHTGDLTSASILRHFYGFKVYFVCGNCDYDITNISQEIGKLNGKFFEKFGEFDLDNKKIAIIHGNDEVLFNKLVESQKYDFVIHGHNHQKEKSLYLKTNVICSGSIKAYELNSVAILDLERSTVNFIDIP